MSSSPKRVRVRHFARAKQEGIRITGITSYDFLTAGVFDEAGVDFLLIGDSAANVVFGYDSTVPVTVDELIPLCRGVAKAASRALVIADLPFGSYEASADEALHTAIRFMKESGVHAVKLEGGVRSRDHISRIVEAGIPVMGHVGFTPQSEHGLGGHVVQGRGSGAEALMEDAVAVQDAGAFAVVIEMVPQTVARQVSEALTIPTIGIGAGPGTDGQILVWSDLAGLSTDRLPRFVKQYASMRDVLHGAVSQWRDEVESGTFPGPEHSFDED